MAHTAVGGTGCVAPPTGSNPPTPNPHKPMGYTGLVKYQQKKKSPLGVGFWQSPVGRTSKKKEGPLKTGDNLEVQGKCAGMSKKQKKTNGETKG